MQVNSNIYSEAERQLRICNACRYCEGYCAVFKAITIRRDFDKNNLIYLAHLCHDCRDCYYACPFIDDHEFSINIPKIMSEIRLLTYKEIGFPKRISSYSFSNPNRFTLLVTLLSIALTFLFSFLLHGKIIGKISSFYQILPYNVIVTVASLITILIVTYWITISLKYIKEINLKEINLNILIYSLEQALSHKWFRGGGAGCDYPFYSGGYRRLLMHLFIVLGFILDIFSTISAAIMQNILRIYPPYPILSLPVLLGLIGGILIIIGSSFLLVMKIISDIRPEQKTMKLLDYNLLIILDMIILTGFLTLGFRSTIFIGIIFNVHLGLVLSLYILTFYGKLVHIPFRFLSLAKFNGETKVKR